MSGPITPTPTIRSTGSPPKPSPREGGPTVVLTTGYTRDDSLRTSLPASIGGTADFQNVFVYDDRLRMTSVTQTGQTGGNAVADKHIVRPVMVKRRGSHGSSVSFAAIFLVVTWVDVCPMGWYDWRMELLGRTTWSYWEGQHCTRRRQSPVNIIA